METPAPRGVGRPSRVTPELIAALAESVGKGDYRTTAAAIVGVTDSMLSKWMAKGKRAPPESKYRQLYDAVTKAEAQWESDTLNVVVEASQGDGGRALRAAQWLLTHHPQARARWGKSADGESAGGKMGEVDVQGARDRLFAQLASIARKQSIEIPGVTDKVEEVSDAAKPDTGADLPG